jgi:hypothetical protein
MNRLPMLAAVTMLAFPATAAAAGTSGTVLSVDAHHHTIQLVDAHHVVHGYRYQGRLPRLHTGSGVAFHRNGTTISHVSLAGVSSRSVSYYARVLRSSHTGLKLAQADGQRVSFASGQIKHKRLRVKHAVRAAIAAVASAGNVTVNILGLEPGVTVLVTQSVDASGNVTITISLPAAGAGSPAGSEQQASGTVDTVNTDTFLLDTADGSQLNLHIAAQTLANLNLSPCDTVDVSYHQDAAMLIADSVTATGTSSASACSSSGPDQTETGTITKVSATGVTVATQDNGPMTFIVDSPDVTAGFVVGDVVDVSYSQLDSGALDASDVEYSPQDATGVVTAVSTGSLTILDGATGQPVTFTANPTDAMFDGVSLGDHVDVSYHLSAGQTVVDQVDDSGSAD